MKKFTAFRIHSTPYQPDLISGLLWELDITGINEEKDFLIAYADDGSKVNDDAISDLLNILKTQSIIESYSLSSEVTEDKNWNELWEKSREVIKVSDRILVKPTFKNYKAKPEEIVITIDPKMSFGTGDHQTTKQVIQMIEKYIKPGMKILDVGSGTGILSIAALNLGASFAVAVDNDEGCYENCLENSKLNNVEERINIINGTINSIKEEDFDIIAANIQKNILILIAEDTYKKVKSDGIIILAGLLDKDELDVINHYQSIGFKHIESVSMEEWVVLVMARR
ncbi:MAG: 50S ribosomal protein L11 methyltransferase [Ignavibacterium sp.]|nr:MAG: 50S ribosomal protein L11 methyltransferase [Ignavibacterium sp.]